MMMLTMKFERAKDWGMCVLFWVCLALVADKFLLLSSPTCVAEQPPLTKRIVEKLNPWR